MPHFMIVLIPYINLLINLSWKIKCLMFEEYGAYNPGSKLEAIREFNNYSGKQGLVLFSMTFVGQQYSFCTYILVHTVKGI